MIDCLSITNINQLADIYYHRSLQLFRSWLQTWISPWMSTTISWWPDLSNVKWLNACELKTLCQLYRLGTLEPKLGTFCMTTFLRRKTWMNFCLLNTVWSSMLESAIVKVYYIHFEITDDLWIATFFALKVASFSPANERLDQNTTTNQISRLI